MFDAERCGDNAVIGEIDCSPPIERPRPPRRAQRVALRCAGGMRRKGGTGVTVQVLDLSTEGFRVETHLELAPGADVWIRLPGLESRHAKVVWADRFRFGCAFVEPLHPAVVATVSAQGRPGG
jgi:hypothetical protein